MRKIVFLALAALMLPMMSFAQQRIMVISDPHVIPQTEIDKNANFDNYMKTQRKMLQLSEPIWHALLDTALKNKPDLVLIPGDLTKDGEAASHDTVAAGIHRLEAAGIPVLVIPGNHDIPASNSWKTHYSGTFKNAVSEDADSYSFATEPFPGVTVLGIDGSDGNASIGKLSASTLAWIEAQADAAKAKGNTIIAMTHWQILEHFDGVASLEPASRFEKPDELRNLLMHHGVHLVLTGHFHVSGITTFRDTTGVTQDSLVEITTGSPITYPCPYRWMTLAPDHKSIEVTTEYINSLPGIDEDFIVYSREWMREHTSNLVPSLARRFWGKIFDKWDEKIVPAMKAAGLGYMAPVIKSMLPQTEAEQVTVTQTYVSTPAINMYLFYSEASESNHPAEGKTAADAMYDGVKNMLEGLCMTDEDDFMGAMFAEAIFDVMKPEIEGPIQSLVEDKTLRATKHADVTDDLELLIGKQETTTIYAVNKLEWEKVYAYVWCEVGGKEYPYKPWPGVEMLVPKSAPARMKAASSDYIFEFEFPQGYDKVIFNNGGTGAQKQETDELTWAEAKPYFVLSEDKDGDGHYEGDWTTPAAVAAAQAVDEKIDAIGTVEYTTASKALIDAARAAYNKLKADEKALVNHLAVLEAAEKTYADKGAAKAVDDKINKIGTVEYTTASKALIEAARAAYNALTADQKALVTKLATLEAAEKKYADLTAAKSVDDKIGEIGTVKLTDASKALIDAARAAYNALTDDQKALVTQLATLEAAEKKYADLTAAKSVDDKIGEIGTVKLTDASKALIDAARAAYNALTDDQKALVTKLATLEAAEQAYEDLKAKDATDRAAAKDVDNKIGEIGVVEYTDASKALIDAARAAYDALTDDQKAFVTQLVTLITAEQRYEELKAEHEATAIEDIQSSDVNVQKVLRNGKVFILIGEKMYDTTGRLVE